MRAERQTGPTLDMAAGGPPHRQAAHRASELVGPSLALRVQGLGTRAAERLPPSGEQIDR
jgi:hypothetical protein